MAKKTVGERLEKARVKAGQTREDLAAAVGSSPKTIYHYESGYRTPSLGRLRELAEALKISPSVFLA